MPKWVGGVPIFHTPHVSTKTPWLGGVLQHERNCARNNSTQTKKKKAKLGRGSQEPAKIYREGLEKYGDIYVTGYHSPHVVRLNLIIGSPAKLLFALRDVSLAGCRPCLKRLRIIPHFANLKSVTGVPRFPPPLTTVPYLSQARRALPLIWAYK